MVLTKRSSKIKKWTVLFTVLLLVIVMCACSKKEEAQGEFVVKIGVIMDFSGENTSPEKLLEAGQMYSAMEMAVQEINENGGVLEEGYKLELIQKDDKGEALNSAACYYQLVEEGACVVIGTNHEEGMKQILDISSRQNVAVITPYVSADFMCDAANFGFQSCISDKYMTQAMVEFVSQMEKDKVAVIYDPSLPQQIIWYEDFIVSLLEHKLETSYADECDFTDADELKEAFEAMEKSQTEYVFVPADVETMEAVIIPAAKQAGYTGAFLCSLSQKDIKLTQGYDVFMPADMPYGKENVTKNTEEFIKKYCKYLSNADEATISQYVLPAYDSVYMIRDAIEKGYLATSASIALKLPFLEGDTLAGYYGINAYGGSQKAVYIMNISDGQPKYVMTVFE